jgi:mycothiol synthase
VSLAPGSVRTFRTGDETAIRQIMEASLRTDSIPGFEQGDIERSLSRVPADPEGALLALEGDRVVGYCIPRHDDLTIHPDARRRGHGSRLVAAARELVAGRGLPYLMLHGPTHLAGTRAFIEAMGASYHSSLWLFELPAGTPVPAPSFPEGFTTRTLSPDMDLADLVTLMNGTFADHPTPLSWPLETVRLVHGLPEFDPQGILLVAPPGEPEQPIAFTKVEYSADPGEDPQGWVGLIGVMPAWRGRGLGRGLLHWGVAYLRGRGAVKIELSAEAMNERATGIYRRAGFVPTIEWPHYILPVSQGADVSPREAVPAG